MKLIDKVMTIFGGSIIILGFILFLMGFVEALILNSLGIVIGIVLPDWKSKEKEIGE